MRRAAVAARGRRRLPCACRGAHHRLTPKGECRKEHGRQVAAAACESLPLQFRRPRWPLPLHAGACGRGLCGGAAGLPLCPPCGPSPPAGCPEAAPPRCGWRGAALLPTACELRSACRHGVARASAGPRLSHRCAAPPLLLLPRAAAAPGTPTPAPAQQQHASASDAPPAAPTPTTTHRRLRLCSRVCAFVRAPTPAPRPPPACRTSSNLPACLHHAPPPCTSPPWVVCEQRDRRAELLLLSP